MAYYLKPERGATWKPYARRGGTDCLSDWEREGVDIPRYLQKEDCH